MRYERAEALTSPAVIGRRYSVRCAAGTVGTVSGWWPVIGEPHADPDITRRVGRHLHIDWRFVSQRRHRRAADTFCNGFEGDLAGLALHKDPGCRQFARELSRSVKLRRFVRTCWRQPPRFEFEQSADLDRWLMWQETQGHHRLDLETMRCPHRGIPLGGVPVIDDVITCPGHGLSFCARSGDIVVRSEDGSLENRGC